MREREKREIAREIDRERERERERKKGRRERTNAYIVENNRNRRRSINFAIARPFSRRVFYFRISGVARARMQISSSKSKASRSAVTSGRQFNR